MFQLINSNLLNQYLSQVSELTKQFDALKDAPISNNDFSFYISVASVFSSKIEGENIELDSFIKHRSHANAFSPDYTKKTDDLYDAYLFAQENQLDAKNINVAHSLLAKNFLAEKQLGKFRTQIMYVTTEDGKIEYVATAPADVNKEMTKWYADLKTLISAELRIEEVFFYAAFLHLTFVKIHPFTDGNGRTARLVEKWFIFERLGTKAWYLQSEKYYYLKHDEYYSNLRKLGLEYVTLDFNQALSFLTMLPQSLEL